MNYTPKESDYREDHNDVSNPFDEAMYDHFRVTSHNFRDDAGICCFCDYALREAIANGEICEFHPKSYFTLAKDGKPAQCEDCELEVMS